MEKVEEGSQLRQTKPLKPPGKPEVTPLLTRNFPQFRGIHATFGIYLFVCKKHAYKCDTSGDNTLENETRRRFLPEACVFWGVFDVPDNRILKSRQLHCAALRCAALSYKNYIQYKITEYADKYIKYSVFSIRTVHFLIVKRQP